MRFAQLRQQPGDLGKPYRVELPDTRPERRGAQPFSYRRVGELRLRRVRAGTGHVDPLAARPFQQLLGEPCLADPRLAGNQSEVRSSARSGHPRRAKPVPL
jgi:hypothetical protein